MASTQNGSYLFYHMEKEQEEYYPFLHIDHEPTSEFRAQVRGIIFFISDL
jgi:hypothetical protein